MKGDSCCCCIRIRIAPPHAPAFPFRLPPPCVWIFGFAQVHPCDGVHVCVLLLSAKMALPYFQPWFGWSCSGSSKGRSLFVDDPKRKNTFCQSLLPRLFFARADQPMITQGMGISWFMRWSPLALLVHTVIHAQTGHERMVRKKKETKKGGGGTK